MNLVQATIRLLPERAGPSVVGAGDSRKGLAIFEAEDFDLLFLDIFMPGMDGLEHAATAPTPAQEAREAVSTIRMRSAAFLAPSFFMILAR
jgi:CheY-like chemotaxis protein